MYKEIRWKVVNALEHIVLYIFGVQLAVSPSFQFRCNRTESESFPKWPYFPKCWTFSLMNHEAKPLVNGCSGSRCDLTDNQFTKFSAPQANAWLPACHSLTHIQWFKWYLINQCMLQNQTTKQKSCLVQLWFLLPNLDMSGFVTASELLYEDHPNTGLCVWTGPTSTTLKCRYRHW